MTSRPFALLASVAASVTALAGCPEQAPDEPTWHQDVAPIVVASCGGCHSDGGPGPFPLDTYAAAAPVADWIVSVTAAGTMPPWGLQGSADSCDQVRPILHDPSLTQLELDTLANWAATGAAEGDAATAAPLPQQETFALPDPSRTLRPDNAYTVEGDGDDFRCVVLDPELTETVWITGLEVVPDATEVVHHALMWLDPAGDSLDKVDDDGGYPCFGDGGIEGGQLLGGWIPGSGAIEYPEGAGLEAPAGSRIVVQYHYFGNGTPTPDASTLDLRWVTDEPERKVLMTLRGNARTAAQGLQPSEDDPGQPTFLIPAGKDQHVERIRSPIAPSIPEVVLFMVAPHMHLVGVDMSVRIERASIAHGPAEECLIHATEYDFDWQRLYTYDVPLLELPRVKGGDTFVLDCTYDNTLENDKVRSALLDAGLDAPQDVGLGESSLDEMCLAVLGVVY